MTRASRQALGWLVVGTLGFLVVPWYALPDSVLGTAWLRDYTGEANAPALIQVVAYGRSWLVPLALLLAAGFGSALLPTRALRAPTMITIGAAGFLVLLVQGFAIGPRGLSYPWLATVLGPLAVSQTGMVIGAALVASAFAMLFAVGIAERGAFRGDALSPGVVAVSVLVVTFTLYPVITILVQALQDAHGSLSVAAFAGRLFTPKIWSIGCIVGSSNCGVAWNTLILALLCAGASTSLGLAFALIVTRTAFRYKKALRVLSILPIITPPFVIGLGLILIFGRSGVVNHLLEWAFRIEPTRWIYGLQGVLVAQVFAFTPIAFLVLIGVVEGIAPSLEEAAQTLRAGAGARSSTFRCR
jgi:iron(III) transport system permease protein